MSTENKREQGNQELTQSNQSASNKKNNQDQQNQQSNIGKKQLEKQQGSNIDARPDSGLNDVDGFPQQVGFVD